MMKIPQHGSVIVERTIRLSSSLKINGREARYTEQERPMMRTLTVYDTLKISLVLRKI